MSSILNSTDQMVDIQEDMRRCPVGTWDSNLGEWGAKLATSLILQTLITSRLINERNYDNIANRMAIEANIVRSHFCNHRIWAKKSNQEYKLYDNY